MEKISWKFLLQCGFQYQYTEKKELLGFKLLNNAKFNFTYWEYDLELDGEIQQNIVCFKSWGKWILIKNNKAVKITTTNELLELVAIKEIFFEMSFVYIIRSKFGCKIGRSKNIDDRKAIFNVKMPFKWHFELIIGVKNSKKLEKFIHFILNQNKINGEWFDLYPDDLKTIKQFIYNNSDYLITFNSPLNKVSPTLK